MATRRPARKRASKKQQNGLMTDLTRVADESKDYVVSGAVQARDYLAKHPALAVAAGAAVLAVGWSARRMWLPAVALAAFERFMPDHLDLPSMDKVVGQLRAYKPSFMN